MELVTQYSWIVEVLAMLVGASMVVAQLRAGQRLMKAQYIADVNERLGGFNDCMDLLFSLKCQGDFEDLSKGQQERILGYFTVFEVIEALRQQNVLSNADVAYFFSGRLGDLTSSPGPQAAILYGPAGKSLAPIFRLHMVMTTYYAAKISRTDVIAKLGDLAASDPSTYKLRARRPLR